MRLIEQAQEAPKKRGEIGLINSNYVQIGFIGAGFAYCFYSVVFRWNALRAIYRPAGVARRLGWVLFVTSLVGWLAAWAVWLVEVKISN